MAETILYVLPLILGRTFDMNKFSVGVDIFPLEQISNPVVIQNPFSETRYNMIDSTKEARDLLDVSGSFSLKVKAGLFKAGASGAYLSDAYNKENTVEILIKATYETVTEILPYNANPFPAWKTLGALGTHYVRSITYGGEVLASVRLICNNTMDKNHIKGSLQLGGRIKIFDIGLEAEGEYLNDVSKTVDTMQIKVFSSVPLSKIPHSMDDLKKALDKFPEDMKKYNDGKGVPVKAELWPLNYLDSTRPQHIINNALQSQLETFEDKFDDLLNTKAALFTWMKSLNGVLSDNDETKVGLLYGEVQKTLRTFFSVIGQLDISQGLDQLKPAEQAYGNNLPGTYYNKYLKLRRSIMNDQGLWTTERGNGITFIHWGQHNCTSGAQTLYKGYASGPKESGGGSNYLCLSQQLKQGPVSEETSFSLLQNATYQLPNKAAGHVPCSTCYLQTRGSVQLFSGLLQCPKGWDMQYSGYLMSGSKNSIHTLHVCLDKESASHGEDSGDSPLKATWTATGRSAGSNTAQKIVPCIICAK